MQHKVNQTRSVKAAEGVTIGEPGKFKTQMEVAGYDVQEGTYKEFDTIKLASEGQLISCFGNNAGSTYLTNFIPPAPNQDPAKGVAAYHWADEEPSKLYDASAAEHYTANPFFSPAGWSYKLDADEAIVILGELPPKCRYFSFINYVLLVQENEGKDYTNAKGFFEIVDEAGTAYHPIFGSLGESFNNYSISSEATPDHLTGNPYGSKFILVTTGSKTTNDTVVKALQAAGFSQHSINESHLPATSLNMGLASGKDTFCLVSRVSQPADQKEYQEYLDNLANTFRVYRVTPREKLEKHTLYGAQELRTRGSNINEAGLLPGVKNDLDTIRRHLIAKYKADYTYEELTADIAVPEGMTGYQNDKNCQGDNRDTSYLKTDNFTLNSDEDFVVVYGVDHTKTKKAVYANAILYSRPMLNGVTSIYNGQFEGSTAEYLPECVNDRDNYYVYHMARKKFDDYTAIIEYSTGNEKGKYYGVDNGQTLFLTYRAYVEEATGVGPSYYEIIYDRAIVFHKK